ncbi:hypothetical protein MGAST_00600 [Mycobacterium gastri 'Wayne']|uniref:Uncharacterized protein n=1 Tax=Mycobacterium gastri TaxID=1777 RepID=A0A1X1VIX0_MYCGS|nr:hypothetical protein MGAST_00600 [Mycobacterium gastri 'Wayne']ORV68939.1 hypothetical protein AWC07_07190 [Mycobacterium gastri]
MGAALAHGVPATGLDQDSDVRASSSALTIHSNAGGVTTGEFILTAAGRRWHQSLVLQRVSPATVRDDLTAAGLVLTTAAPNSTRWLLAKRAENRVVPESGRR